MRVLIALCIVLFAASAVVDASKNDCECQADCVSGQSVSYRPPGVPCSNCTATNCQAPATAAALNKLCTDQGSTLDGGFYLSYCPKALKTAVALIVGLVIGSICLLICILVAICFCCGMACFAGSRRSRNYTVVASPPAYGTTSATTSYQNQSQSQAKFA